MQLAISAEQQIAEVRAVLHKIQETPRFRGQQEIIQAIEEQLMILLDLNERGQLQPMLAEEPSDWLHLVVSAAIVGISFAVLR